MPVREVRHDGVHEVTVKGTFKRIELTGLWQKNHHREFAPLVSQFHRLIPIALRVTAARLLAHHWHGCLTTINQVKSAFFSRSFAKGNCPRCIEVDGVGEDKSSQFVDNVCRNEVSYPVLRLLADPIVDGETRLFRCLNEIEEP